MAASFPGTLWTWTDQVANVSTMDVGDANGPAAEIIAIQTHLGAGSIAAGQQILTGTAPWLRLYNTTEEDTDGGRESQIQWRGEQSGGEISTLGLIEISHDGTSDDEKGKFFLKLNDTDDANSPTTVMTVGSLGGMTLSGTPTNALTISGACTAGVNVSGACTTGITISGACTTGINITGATTDAIKVTGTPATSDITLHNGATINNDAAGSLTITEDAIKLVAGGYGKIELGGPTDWGTGATGTLIDGTGYDWVSSTVGHVDSGALATACAAAYHALTVTPATHSTASSFFGTWTELYIQATQNMANSANCAAVWGQIEMGATVSTTDVADCFTAPGYFNIITGSTFVNDAAHVVNGVRVQSEISSTSITNSGRLAAFECLTKSGSYQDWDYGIYADGILRAGYFNSSLTGSSALNSFEMTVGDATTPASGYAHGIHVTYNKSGVDTGSGASTMQFNAIGADVTVSGAGGGTAGYYSLYTYVQKSGSPDLSNCAIFGANLEMTEMGATDYFGCLWLNKYNTTKGSTTDSFILMTNQGSGVTESAIDFLGTGYPDYFLKFAANSGGFLDAGTGDTAACSGHIEVNTPSGSKYIRLYASAS